MDRISFDIFEPDNKKFHFTPNLIVYSLWFIIIGFFWLFDNILPEIKEARTIVACCVGLISVYYLVTSFFKYEPLNGILKGKIIFNNDSILINEKVYQLKNVTGIDFGFIDYYGEMKISYRGNFNPLISQGIHNFVTFFDSDKKTIKVYFRMQGKYGSQALHAFINEAVQCGAMSYYRAIDLIDVENVRKPGASE